MYRSMARNARRTGLPVFARH